MTATTTGALYCHFIFTIFAICTPLAAVIDMLNGRRAYQVDNDNNNTENRVCNSLGLATDDDRFGSFRIKKKNCLFYLFAKEVNGN